MSTEIKRRRGNTFEHATFIGAEGELTVDTDKKTLVVHDGATAGGIPLAKSSHTHTAAEIIGGSGITLSVSAGGTGASTVAGALGNFGIGVLAEDIRFVESDAAFASVYSGASKTIVLGANSYTTPAVFIQGINLVGLGDPSDVVLTGAMAFSASGGGVISTTFEGISIVGNLTFTSPFDNTLLLHRFIQSGGTVSINSASAIVDATDSKLSTYLVQAGKLITETTSLTDGNSAQTGGLVVHRDLISEIDSVNQVIRVSSSGELAIEGIRLKNPSGPGVEITGDALATINGFILSGLVGTNGLAVSGSATLRLGTHNLTAASAFGSLVSTSSGNIIPLDHPLVNDSVTSSTIANAAIQSSHLGASVVTRFNVEGELKQPAYNLFVNQFDASAGLGTPHGTGVNEIVIVPNFTYDGFLREVRIETVAGAAPASSMTISLVRYGKRSIGGSAFADASQLVMVSGISVAAGQTVITTSTLGQAASVLGLGSPLSGFSVSAADDLSASTGGGFTILACNFLGGTSMDDLMVSYTLQIDTD